MFKQYFLLFAIIFNLHALSLIYPTTQSIEDIDISEYLASEKLVGLRGYWDGEKLLDSNGLAYSVPKEFIKDFPPFELDGELYCHTRFDNIMKDVYSSKFNCVKLYVFEVPNQKGSLIDRLKVLDNYLKEHPNDNIVILKQKRFKDKSALMQYYNELIASGSRGIILHKIDENYTTTMGDVMIKLEPDYESYCILSNYIFDKDNNLKGYVCKFFLHNAVRGVRGKEQFQPFSESEKNYINIVIDNNIPQEYLQNPPSIGTKIRFSYKKLDDSAYPIDSKFLRFEAFY